MDTTANQRRLSTATFLLPPEVAFYVLLAIESGRFRFGAWSYERDLAVCPIVAGAKLAGVWHEGAIAPGKPEWGSPDAPSASVEEFAACFDICAEDEGLNEALATVRLALHTRLDVVRAAWRRRGGA